MPLIGFLSSLSCLYSRNACEIPRTLASSRSVTCVPTTTAPITCRSPPRAAQIGVTASIRSPEVSSRTVMTRSEEHTSELQSQSNLVCRLLLEKKKKKKETDTNLDNDIRRRNKMRQHCDEIDANGVVN